VVTNDLQVGTNGPEVGANDLQVGAILQLGADIPNVFNVCAKYAVWNRFLHIARKQLPI
jgi:hypothetical protein